MKISDNTIGILRNFSDINANILLKPGKAIEYNEYHEKYYGTGRR